MSTESKDASQTATSSKRTLSPLMFMFVAFAGLTVLLGVFVGLMAAIEPEIPTGTALQEVMMSDGTILALEAVTWGKLHEYEVEFPTQGFEFFPSGRSRMINQGTSKDQTVLWLSRRDAVTGKALDFDWWAHSTVVDSHGCEIEDSDNDARRHAHHAHGSSGSGGRPFQSISARSSGEQYTSIIVTSGLPAFRHEGDTFTVRLYDLAGTKVGEFQIKDPSPTKGSYPVWKPEELPVTRTTNDLTVTLTSLAGQLSESQSSRNGRSYIRKRTQLNYDFQVKENGESTNRWQSRSMMVSDALGNSLNRYDISQLCEEEQAWKLAAKFYRIEKRENFDESELWTVKDLELPAADKTQYINKKETCQGVEFELIAAGGGGKKATYSGMVPKNSGGYGHSSQIGDVTVAVDVESDHRKPGNLSIDCKLPHIVLRWSGQTANNLIAKIDATDGQGRPIELNGPYPGYGGDAPNVYIISRPQNSEVKDPIEKISFTWSVQEAREFEFLVKPPKAAPPKPRQRTPYTVERRLARAKQDIENHEKNLANNPGNSGGYYHNAIAWAIVTAPEELRTPERLATALEYAQLAGDESRNSQPYDNTLAMALLRSGNATGAITRFESNLASRMDSNNALFDLYGLALAQFQSGDPVTARKTYDKAVAKQQVRAPYIQNDSQWHDLYHLREELQTHFLGASPRDLIAQADDLVAGGKLMEAAEVFDRLLAVSEDDVWQWYRSAVLQLHIGNQDAWKRHCKRMLELFRNTDHPETAERVGKTCLLSAASDAATQSHAHWLIETALAKNLDNMWFRLASGLSQYRAGEDVAAIPSLEQALTLSGRANSADVCIYALLALSRFRTGEKEAAKAALAQAELIRAEKLPALTAGKLKDGWHDVLIAEILLREARSVVSE